MGKPIPIIFNVRGFEEINPYSRIFFLFASYTVNTILLALNIERYTEYHIEIMVQGIRTIICSFKVSFSSKSSLKIN